MTAPVDIARARAEASAEALRALPPSEQIRALTTIYSGQGRRARGTSDAYSIVDVLMWAALMLGGFLAASAALVFVLGSLGLLGPAQ